MCEARRKALYGKFNDKNDITLLYRFEKKIKILSVKIV